MNWKGEGLAADLRLWYRHNPIHVPNAENGQLYAVCNQERRAAEQIVQTSALAANTWVHVALTLGNGSASLYVNGEVKATANVTIKPSDFKPNKNYIGKSQFADPLFNGLIDEFRVYNRALSADEIKAVTINPVSIPIYIKPKKSLTTDSNTIQTKHGINCWMSMDVRRH